MVLGEGHSYLTALLVLNADLWGGLAREYGLDASFEALVADIAARFVRKFQPEWEKCWIAELEGERVGSVFVARKSATTAQLRMLVLTPQARGLGLGHLHWQFCAAAGDRCGVRQPAAGGPLPCR